MSHLNDAWPILLVLWLTANAMMAAALFSGLLGRQVRNRAEMSMWVIWGLSSLMLSIVIRVVLGLVTINAPDMVQIILFPVKHLIAPVLMVLPMLLDRKDAPGKKEPLT